MKGENVDVKCSWCLWTTFELLNLQAQTEFLTFQEHIAVNLIHAGAGLREHFTWTSTPRDSKDNLLKYGCRRYYYLAPN